MLRDRSADTTNFRLCRSAGGLLLTALLLSCGSDSPMRIVESPLPVSAVESLPPNPRVAPGGSLQLSAILRDSLDNTLSGRAIAWTTSQAGIANVSSAGVVTGVAAGTARITATSEGKQASVDVIVAATGGGGAASYAPSLITYLGGGGDEDMIRDVATDAQGNIYVAGGTNSANFPVTAGAFDVTFNNPGGPQQDVFVQKRTASGQVLWSTYLGGTGYDRAYAVEVDAQGFVYVAGRAGAGFPVTSGALQTTFAGGTNAGDPYGPQDGFICKLRPDGTGVVFCTYFGNDDYVPIRDIAVDAAGNIYLSSSSDRGTFPAAWFTNAYQSTRRGGRDMLVARLNAQGNRIDWATFVGGSGDELNTSSVRVDAAGNVYAMTTTRSSDAPTNGGFDRTLGGTSDILLVKLSPNGSQLLFGTYVGGSDGDFTETHELWVTPAGESVVAATTRSPDFPTTASAFQRTLQGVATSPATGQGNNSGDGFIARISTTGSLVAATYLGGRHGDGIEGVFVNGAGEVFVSGTTFSDNFPTTVSTTAPGGSDMFVAHLSADLSSLLFAGRFGGNQAETTRSMWVDGSGNLLVAGYTDSGNIPLLSATQSALLGGSDGLLVKVTRQ